MTAVFTAGNAMEFPPARHVAAFAVIDRDAFIPNLFAFPVTGQPVAFRPEALSLRNRDSDILMPDGRVPEWSLICREYDGVLLIGEEGARILPPCGARVAHGARFELWRISRVDGVGSARRRNDALIGLEHATVGASP